MTLQKKNSHTNVSYHRTHKLESICQEGRVCTKPPARLKKSLGLLNDHGPCERKILLLEHVLLVHDDRLQVRGASYREGLYAFITTQETVVKLANI